MSRKRAGGAAGTRRRARSGATWSNWAGNSVCAPAEVVEVHTEADIIRAVTRAAMSGQRLRAVGSGHSFTDAACTEGVQLRLGDYGRLLEVDREAGTATVEAGMRLSHLNEVLAARGLAMPNLGDIAYQTVSGAMATGTHGTGERLGGLATAVAGLRLVGPDGAVTCCSASEDPDLFTAARVGLGALGVVSTLTLQCVPAFNLHAVEEPVRLDRVLADLDDLAGSNDHFEFYWVPHTRWALTKRNNRTDAPVGGRGRVGEWRDRMLLENLAFGAVCRVGRRAPALIPRLSRLLPSGGRVEYVERSDRVFTSPRLVHFYEMEYAIPRAALPEALDAVVGFVERSGLRLSFPVEVRVAAADDIWLSTAYGRDSAYVAVHVYRGMPYEQYFRGVEEIMAPLGGRPHWGKLHYQDAASLAPRYPAWDRFQEVRRRVDPTGVLANHYTDRVLGPASGDRDRVLGPASGNRDRVLGPASGDTDRVLGPASGDTDRVLGPASGDTDRVLGPAGGSAAPPEKSGPSRSPGQTSGQG